MPTDDRAVLLSISANITNLERQLRRAGVLVETTATNAERRTQTMAGRMNRSLGTIDADAFRRGVERTSAAAGVALGAIIAYSVRAASSAAETANAFQVAMGTQTAAAQRFARSYSSEVGRSLYTVQAQMSQVQLILTGVGQSADVALRNTQMITQRAVDLGSLWNVDDAEAFRAIISGINGEAEPMRRFGVAMNQAAVEAELLRMGIRGGADAASQAQVAQARLNFIMRQSAIAQGDATNTAGSLTNQTRRMQAQFHDTAVEFGQRFLPVANQVVGWANQALETFNNLPSGIQNAGLAMIGLAAASGPIMAVVNALRLVIGTAVAARTALLGVAGAGAVAGAARGAGAVGAVGAGAGIIGGGFAAVGAVVGGGIIHEGNRIGRAAEVALHPEGRSAQELASAARAYREVVGGVNGRQVAERLEALAAQRMFAPDGNALNDFVRQQGIATATRLAGGDAPPAATGGGGGRGGRGGRGRKGAGSGGGRAAASRREAEGGWELMEGQGGQYEWVYVNPEGVRTPTRFTRRGEDGAISADTSLEVNLRERDPDREIDVQEIEQSVRLIGENFGEQLREEMQEATETLERGLRGALEASVRGGWPGLVKYMTDLLLERLVAGMASNLVTALQGAGGGAGGGGWLGTAARGVGWLFGVGRNAEGTDNWRGGMSWVGERGPELVNLPRGAQVIPNHRLADVGRMMNRASVIQPIFNDFSGAVVTEDLMRAANAHAERVAARAGQGAVATARRQAPSWVAQRQREGR